MRFTTRPELSGTFGMVASTHWLASAAGMAALEQGGNAFDAAVAAGLTLQVVEPHLNGPGGDAPIILYDAARAEPTVVCGQGPAPAGATIAHYRDLGLELVPGTGMLAACVPGAFDAWMLILRDHGTLPLAEVMRFPIHYAEHGFPMLPRISEAIADIAGVFREEWPSSAELWLDRGRAPAPGGMWRNPTLAGTWRRLVAEAEAAGPGARRRSRRRASVFLRGFVAEAIADFVGRAEVMDSSGRRNRGCSRATTWPRSPRRRAAGDLEHRGLQVCKAGPWSQGPVQLQMLALLEGFDLAAMGHLSAEYVHTVLECEKLAFADREAWYGDPAFADVPLATLLSRGYADERRALVGEEASFDLRAGAPDGREPRLAHVPAAEPVAAGFGVGEPTLGGRGDGPIEGDTCHVDVVDRHGNMVSATPSGGWLHASPAIPGLGLCLGTRAQMFWLEEGLPDALEPGKRPRTTLTPSLGLRDGEGVIAWGTPGGDGQDQWSLQFILSHLDFGLNLQEAIDAPAFTSTHFPTSFYPRESEPGHVEIEARIGPEVIDGLRARGHDVGVAEPWSIGRLSAVSRGPDGVLRAAANPRGMQGYAIGR